MKCPKCGFIGLDSTDECKKCGKDLAETRKKLGLTAFGAGNFGADNYSERERTSAVTNTAELGDGDQLREETGFEGEINQADFAAEDQKGHGQKDELQQPVDFGTEQKAKSVIEPMEDNFSLDFDNEKDFFSAETEGGAEVEKNGTEIELLEELPDDFDFHTMPKPQLIDDYPDKEHNSPVSPLLEPDAENQKDDSNYQKPEK